MILRWFSVSQGRDRGIYPLISAIVSGFRPVFEGRSFRFWGKGASPLGFWSILFIAAVLISFYPPMGIAAGSEDLLPSSVCDISVTFDLASETIIAGANYSYALTVTNSGPDDASGVRVTSTPTVPEGVVVASEVSRGSYDRKTGVWTLGDLPSGSVERLNFEVSIAPSVPSGMTISYAAEVAGDGIDPVPENNQDVFAATITTDAEVVAMVNCPSPEGLGDDRPLYIIEISNNGPSNARNVWFRDLLPPAIWLQRAGYRGEARGNDEGEWIGFLDLGDLAPRETKTILIYADKIPVNSRSVPGVTITVSWMDTVDPACNSVASSCDVGDRSF